MAHSSTSSGTVTSHVLRGLGVTKIDGRDQSLMTSEKEILYVAGRNVVWHNLVRDRVRVLPQTPRTQSILAIAVCPKRRYVAVCEQQDQSHYSSTGETPLPQVSIIDLISGAGPKRLRTLIATEDTHLSFNTVLNSDGTIPPPPNFTCAEFSKDSKSLLCLVGAPYNGLVVFDWFRSRKVGTCTINASVNQCRFNPIDSSQVSTSGPQHLRVWKVQEGMLKGYPSIPLPSGGSSITDHAWTKDDRMAATTDHGELLIYDEGVCIQTITSKAIGLEEHDGLSCIAGLDDRGFICGGPRGSVCIVEMTDDKNRLEGRDPFKVPCKVRAIKDKATPQTIISLACSPKCDAVSLCFPDNVGLLNMSDVWLKAEQSSKKEDDENGADGGSKKEVAVSLSDHNEEKEKNTNEIKEMEEEERNMDNSSLSENTQTKLVECDINYIVKGYHTGTITCIATCSRKPFLITCSKEDKSVRLWNYRTHICIDALTFKNDAQRPLCVDIHPSGHLILIGFSGRLHLYHVRIDALRYSREILVKGARMAKFSGHGGLIAVACSRRLEVYRTYTEECIGGFTGHSMPITSFSWSKDDMGIVSCGMDGSVYEWDLNAMDGTGHTPCGTRAGEHHSELPKNVGFSYNTIVCGSNGSVCVSGAIQGGIASKTQSGSGSSDNISTTKTPVGFGSGAPKGSGSRRESGSTSSSLSNNGHQMLRAWRKKHLDGKGFVLPTATNVTAVDIQSHNLIAGGDDGSVTFYDWPLEFAEKAGISLPHQVSISAIAVSPDNKVIFTGGIDGTLMMSEVVKGHNEAVFHGNTVSSTSRSSRIESSATSTRPYLDEIICLTDTQDHAAFQGKIMDLEATIIDIKSTYRFEKREALKEREKIVRQADSKLANEKKMAHEMEIELKRLLKASESEGRAKSDAKEAQHMQTAKLLEDLYDRKLVMKQKQLRDTQNKLRDLIVRHEDMKIKHENDVTRIKKIASDREKLFQKKFAKEKKQMEQYIQFIKDRYEDTADAGEDLHDEELVKLKQQFETEKLQMELKMQTTQGEIVLLKKSASMMKESLDEEKKKAGMARVDKMAIERKLKENRIKMENIMKELKKSNDECSMKDEQIKSHLRRVGDLERVRRVLQHQLHEARGQLEPMDTEMTTMKETIEELNKEYTSGMKAAAVLERKTKNSNHKQAILNKELIKTNNRVQKLKSTILKFSRDVESIVTQPGSNHAKWAEGLLTLYKNYVTNLHISGKISGPNDETTKEFDRQRMFMEKTVKALKKQSETSENMINITKKRTVQENSLLVTELNTLRKTVKRLKNTINQLESEKLQNSNTRYGTLSQFRNSGSLLSGSFNGGNSLAADNTTSESMTNNSNNSSEYKYESKYDAELAQQQQQQQRQEEESENISRRRSNALNQVARTHFGSSNRSAPRLGGNTRIAKRRPASAIAGSSGRPKSGGRPLTAQERRRKMPLGPSLSRSMSRLRASNSEKTLSIVQSKLDQAYMNEKAKAAEIDRLRNQLKEKDKRNKQLEEYVNSGGRGGLGGIGVNRKNTKLTSSGKSSPGSASILSEYSRTSSGGNGGDIDSISPTNSVSGRQVLSPLNQRKAIKKSLRVG